MLLLGSQEVRTMLGSYDKAEHGDILAKEPIYRADRREIQPHLVGDSAYPLLRVYQNSFLKVPET